VTAAIGTPRRARVWLAGLAGALAAAALAVAHWFGASPPVPDSRPGVPPAAQTLAEGKARGRADAAVVIEVYSDFLCTHCAEFAAAIEPALVAEFADAGTARLVYRHFPVLGPAAEAAAEAAECAVAQQRFWAYHDALFARARRSALRRAAEMDAAAREAGLNISAFRICRQDGAGRAGVETDRAEGHRRGVEGTPTTFVGGRKIVGLAPLEVYRAAVRAAGAR
jgi:protein-disulfide isomerase